MGTARREFMQVDDAAAAVLSVVDHHEESQFINVGWYLDASIRELVGIIAPETGFLGKLSWRSSN
jgi:GDP-L-fucose synthase